MLNALSKSGLPKETQYKFSEAARKVWKGWQVNLSDIEFARKPNSDRKRIGKGGAADVYLGRIKLRDENDDIIEGKHMEVAVKGLLESTESKLRILGDVAAGVAHLHSHEIVHRDKTGEHFDAGS